MFIGRYEVLAEIGRGGAGRVVRARSPDGREVAIKVLLAAEDKDHLARFAREAQLLAELGEAHGFVPVLDHGDTPEGPFIVLPFLGGGTLRARLEKGALGVENAVALGRALARALAEAHARGIVHRDLKPENVLFTAGGVPLVADLGLARQRFGAASLTESGVVGGTLGYMPPEQLDSLRAAGPPADVFALGAILYECLTGKRAFEATGILRFVQELERGPRPLASACPEAPPWLAAVVARALAPAPAARFPDGRALAAALESQALAGVGRGAFAFALLSLVFVLGLAVGVALSRGKSPAAATPSAPAPPSTPTRGATAEIRSPLIGTLLAGEFTVEATVAGSLAKTAGVALVLSSGEDSRGEGPLGPGGTLRVTLRVPSVEAEGRVDVRVDGKAVASVGVRLTQAPLRHLPSGLAAREAERLHDGTRVEVYEYTRGALRLPMVWVPPWHGKGPERPGFWIARYETTRGEYFHFCDRSGREQPAAPAFWPQLENEERHPISNVSWNDAVAYCEWAGLRLPSEEQWKRAAGGADGRRYPWGNDWDPERANFADASCPEEVDVKGGENHLMQRFDRDTSVSDGFPYTAPVGSFPKGASPVGAFDMAGNVWEMTQDKKFRGGSFLHLPKDCAVKSEVGASAAGTYVGVDLGFRAALGGAP